MSEITDGDVCYIPITESHFLSWLYPWKFPGLPANTYVKGVFKQRTKGAQTISVACDEFDQSEFSVNAAFINKNGNITQQSSNMFIVTNADIQSY